MGVALCQPRTCAAGPERPSVGPIHGDGDGVPGSCQPHRHPPPPQRGRARDCRDGVGGRRDGRAGAGVAPSRVPAAEADEVELGVAGERRQHGRARRERRDAGVGQEGGAEVHRGLWKCRVWRGVAPLLQAEDGGRRLRVKPGGKGALGAAWSDDRRADGKVTAKGGEERRRTQRRSPRRRKDGGTSMRWCRAARRRREDPDGAPRVVTAG